MIRKTISLVLSTLAAAALAGCSPLIATQVEEPEVCVTQSFSIPGASAPPLAGIDVTVANQDSMTVPELPTQSKDGQVTLNEKVHLTRASLSAAPGSDLSFIKAVTITISSMTQPLMSYQNSSPGNVTSVDLNTSSSDLVSALTGGRELQFSYSVTGQIPQQATTANLNLCIYAKAEVGVH